MRLNKLPVFQHPHTVKLVVDVALLATFIYVLYISTNCQFESIGNYIRQGWVLQNRILWLGSILLAIFVSASSYKNSYVTNARKKKAHIIEYVPLVLVLSVSVLSILPILLQGFGFACLHFLFK